MTILVFTGLLLGSVSTIETASSLPSSSFTVGVTLDKYVIEMLVSTEEDTKDVILGWVNVDNMKPGETVSVQLYANGYHDLYATPDPVWFTFERDGRRYFNLTVVLKEDAPITEEFEVVVSAEGKTYLTSALSYVELVVKPIFQLSATAKVASKPVEAAPGGTTKGRLLVTNTGSIYGQYNLQMVSDPDGVVEEVAFTRESDLTPGFYEDFEFRIEIAEDAEPGIHRVTIALWANTQYVVSGHMDTFTVEVHVTERSGGVSGTLLVSVIAIIAIIGVAAFLLRRPWDNILT